MDQRAGHHGRVLCSPDVLPANAGEVGDGPDQGHSGGADSVPPAPILYLADQQSAPIAGRRGE